MTLPFSLFLALKYLKPKRTFLSVVTVLSVLGVLLGVTVLIIVLSVMTGFDEMWRTKILDFNAHLTVSVPGNLEGQEEDLCAAIEAVPGVKGAAPFLQSLVFIQKPNGQGIGWQQALLRFLTAGLWLALAAYVHQVFKVGVTVSLWVGFGGLLLLLALRLPDRASDSELVVLPKKP